MVMFKFIHCYSFVINQSISCIDIEITAVKCLKKVLYEIFALRL